MADFDILISDYQSLAGRYPPGPKSFLRDSLEIGQLATFQGSRSLSSEAPLFRENIADCVRIIMQDEPPLINSKLIY